MKSTDNFLSLHGKEGRSRLNSSMFWIYGILDANSHPAAACTRWSGQIGLAEHKQENGTVVAYGTKSIFVVVCPVHANRLFT